MQVREADLTLVVLRTAQDKDPPARLSCNEHAKVVMDGTAVVVLRNMVANVTPEAGTPDSRVP